MLCFVIIYILTHCRILRSRTSKLLHSFLSFERVGMVWHVKTCAGIQSLLLIVRIGLLLEINCHEALNKLVKWIKINVDVL